MQKKNFIYAVLCICVAFLVSGCGKKENNPPQNTVTPTVTVSASVGIGATEATPAPDEIPTVAPPENKEITIYVIDSEIIEKEAVTVLVDAQTELTPEFIVEQVVTAMEDIGFIIGINDIIIEGDSVRIDYRNDTAPVCAVGSTAEGLILDIIGQSILDNLPQYKKIYVSVMGEKYSSGHFEFELDEVYIGR